MEIKRILTEALNLNGKEWNALANYAYCDRFNPKTQTIEEWQDRQKEAMMEEEQMELELGESMWEPGVKGMLISIFNRKKVQ